MPLRRRLPAGGLFRATHPMFMKFAESRAVQPAFFVVYHNPVCFVKGKLTRIHLWGRNISGPTFTLHPA